METTDLKMLVAFGKLGMDLAASKILSLCVIFGIVAVSGYSVYASSWQGAACVGVLAFCFAVAVKSESKRHVEEE